MTRRRPERAERTTAIRTFLIADIRGYTRFTNQLGDEAASRLAAKFAEVAAEGVEAYDGTLVELRGDEALAVFDSPRAAIRAAAELQSAFGAETSLEPHLPLAVGMGVDAGEAVPVGDGYRGAALNLAARLCASAAAGEIRASATVVHLAGSIDGLAYVPLDSMELKGIGGAISPFSVSWGSEASAATLPPPATGPPPALPAELDSVVPFAGREQELRRLRWVWRRTRHGRPRIVVVTGPEGIGKTRLAGAIAEAVRRDGRTVVYRAGTAVAELAELAPIPTPCLIVLDDMDRASTPVSDVWRDGLARVAPIGMTLVLARQFDDTPTAGTGTVDRLELDRLDADAVREIAVIYADESIDEVPLRLIETESDGVPSAVHRLASQWARNHAVRRLGDSAERTASGRRALRSAEEALILDVGGLERTRERARLYVDADVDEERRVDICPYKGLATFEAADAPYFFGRDRLIAELVARLVGSPFVAIIGASGSGKSSVLRAGLLPGLADGVIPTSAGWVQVVLRPGARPLSELETALHEAAGDGAADDPEASIDAALRPLASDQRLLIVVDQFEELFSTPDDDERRRFIELLTRPRSRLKVIVALRSDHYAAAATHPALARAIGTDQVLVSPVTAEELTAIVDRPAQSVGLRVEPDLSAALVTDAGQEAGALPLLSTTLLELWQARTDRTLTLAAYHALGGLRGAVARLAEAAYGRLSPEQQTRARGVFLRLAGHGEGDTLVRRRVPIAEFDMQTDAVTGEAIASLTQQRLLTTGDGYVEVAHEALLREWPRLRTWLEDDAAGHALRLHLIGAARDWDERGREPADLYRGARLAAVLDWTAEHELELNATERAFVDESRRLAELDAERERHTNRRLRLLLAGAAIFLVAAVVAGGFALLQRQEAVAEARRAEAEADRALVQEEAAERAETVARSRELAAAAVAYMDDDPSLGKLLALTGASISDPPIETLASLHQAWAQDRIVARHSWGDRPIGELRPALTPDGRLLAMGGWDSHELEVIDPVSGEIIWSFATESIDYKLSPPYFTSDGTRLVASLRYLPEGDSPLTPREGRAGIFVWDAPTGELVHVLDAGRCGAALLAVGNDVAMLATMRFDAPCNEYADPAREFINIVTGEQTLLTEFGGEAAVSADDSVAAYDDLAGDRFVSVVIDVRTGAEILRIEPHLTGSAPDYFTRALNRDGSLLLYGDQPIFVWDVDAAAEIGAFHGHAGISFAATFGEDGQSVFSTGRDRTLREWDARSFEEIARHRGIGTGSLAIASGRAVVAQRDEDEHTARVVDLQLRGEAGSVETCRGFVPARNLEVVRGMASLAIVECPPEGSGESIVADLASSAIVMRLGGLASVQRQAVSPDGTRLARQEGSATTFGPLTIRDVESGAVLLELEGWCQHESGAATEPGVPPPGCEAAPTPPVAIWSHDLAWSPDGSRIALANHGGVGGGLLLWDATDGRLLRGWAEPVSPGSVMFTPDGAELLAALGSADGPARILRISPDAGTIDEEVELKDFDAPAIIGWSPDASILYATDASFGFGRLAKLRAEDFAVIGQVDYEGPIKSFAMSRDGSRIATGSVDGFVRVWDAETLSLVHEIFIGDVQVQGLNWVSPTHLAVAPEDGNILVYTTDAEELLELVRDSLTRGFTPAECVRFSFGQECPTLNELRAGD